MGVDGTPGNAPSGNPAVSGFGLFVAYQSTATNLTSMAVPAGVQQVYLYQNCPANSFPGLGQTGGMFPGCTPTTSVASLDSSGKPGDKDSINPSLDLIGLSVAFESLADNIVGNMPGNGFHQATFSWHRSRVHVHGGARVLLRAKLICPRPKHPAGSARHKAAGNQSQHLADVRRR
jgi:hypothetical protein